MNREEFIKKLKEYPHDFEKMKKKYEREVPSGWALLALVLGILALAFQIDKAGF